MELKDLAEKALEKLKHKGAHQAVVSAHRTESQEFQAEAGRMTLLRTTFDQGLQFSIVKDHRSATVGSNQFSADAIDQLSENVFQSAAASPQDEAYGFGQNEGQHSFSLGQSEINEPWIEGRLQEFLDTCQARFPKAIIEGAVLKFVKTNQIFLSSSGSSFTDQQCHYDGQAMFTSKEGSRSSSFNYAGFQIPADPQILESTHMMNMVGIEKLLQESEAHLAPERIPKKFVGDLILTPHCLTDFCSTWTSYLSGMTLLKKDSLYKDKLGKKIASDKVSLRCLAHSKDFASHLNWTADGYLTQDLEIINRGNLQNYILGHYTAQKLGLQHSRLGSGFVMDSGSGSLREMITKTKQGILMARYSAGRPSDSGDISGVAKNSFYIEDGKIQFPISETMVSGNLAEMLLSVQDVSRESINFGTSRFPWLRISGITAS